MSRLQRATRVLCNRNDGDNVEEEVHVIVSTILNGLNGKAFTARKLNNAFLLLSMVLDKGCQELLTPANKDIFDQILFFIINNSTWNIIDQITPNSTDVQEEQNNKKLRPFEVFVRLLLNLVGKHRSAKTYVSLLFNRASQEEKSFVLEVLLDLLFETLATPQQVLDRLHTATPHLHLSRYKETFDSLVYLINDSSNSEVRHSIITEQVIRRLFSLEQGTHDNYRGLLLEMFRLLSLNLPLRGGHDSENMEYQYSHAILQKLINSFMGSLLLQQQQNNTLYSDSINNRGNVSSRRRVAGDASEQEHYLQLANGLADILHRDTLVQAVEEIIAMLQKDVTSKEREGYWLLLTALRPNDFRVFYCSEILQQEDTDRNTEKLEN